MEGSMKELGWMDFQMKVWIDKWMDRGIDRQIVRLEDGQSDELGIDRMRDR